MQTNNAEKYINYRIHCIIHNFLFSQKFHYQKLVFVFMQNHTADQVAYGTKLFSPKLC